LKRIKHTNLISEDSRLLGHGAVVSILCIDVSEGPATSIIRGDIFRRLLLRVSCYIPKLHGSTSHITANFVITAASIADLICHHFFLFIALNKFACLMRQNG